MPTIVRLAVPGDAQQIYQLHGAYNDVRANPVYIAESSVRSLFVAESTGGGGGTGSARRRGATAGATHGMAQ